MTIRFKILSLAFAILIIFGAVVGISTWLQHRFLTQLIAVTRYHTPLRTLIADFDVRTDEYELIMLRLLQHPDVTQNELESVQAQAHYAVNLASRLEGTNKVYGTRIIIAEHTLRLARQEVEARELDLITVAGKSEPVRIYELLGRAGELSPSGSELAHEFENGLRAYRAREWETAEQQFHHCLEMRPADGPSALYIARIAAMRTNPPPDDWDGIWHLTKQ